MEPFSTSGLLEIYSRLFIHFGDPRWWPGETPFEIALGAILTQNTSWKNVETAISNLKEKHLMTPSALAVSDMSLVSKTIRSAGYYNQKARYLASFSDYVMKELNGNVQGLSAMDIQTARDNLLDLKGIGMETADSILCYAADHPLFVVDAYTYRIMKRLDPDEYSKIDDSKGCKYAKVQEMVMRSLMGDALFYNRFHALLVLLGKDICRPRPKCDICPLKDICNTSNL
jgi:endonuclease-3 related protein